MFIIFAASRLQLSTYQDNFLTIFQLFKKEFKCEYFTDWTFGIIFIKYSHISMFNYYIIKVISSIMTPNCLFWNSRITMYFLKQTLLSITSVLKLINSKNCICFFMPVNKFRNADIHMSLHNPYICLFLSEVLPYLSCSDYFMFYMLSWYYNNLYKTDMQITIWQNLISSYIQTDSIITYEWINRYALSAWILRKLCFWRIQWYNG